MNQMRTSTTNKSFLIICCTVGLVSLMAESAAVAQSPSDSPSLTGKIPKGTWEFAGLTDPLNGRLFPAGGYFIRDNWSLVATMAGFHSSATEADLSTTVNSFQATTGSF